MEPGDTKFIGCSQDVFSPHGQDDFCTRDNWQTAVVYLANELEMFGLASPCTKGEADQTQSSLDVITLGMLVSLTHSMYQCFDSALYYSELQLEAGPDVQILPGEAPRDGGRHQSCCR